MPVLLLEFCWRLVPLFHGPEHSLGVRIPPGFVVAGKRVDFTRRLIYNVKRIARNARQNVFLLDIRYGQER